MWRRVTAEYAIDDAAGVEMLTQCCQAVDLAEALSARIAEDGEIIRTMNGIKAHPAIKDGLAARSFVVQNIAEIGPEFRASAHCARASARILSHADKTNPA